MLPQHHQVLKRHIELTMRLFEQFLLTHIIQVPSKESKGSGNHFALWETAAVYGGIKGGLGLADENLLSCNLDKVSGRACAILLPSLPLFILHVTYPNCTLLNPAFIIKKDSMQTRTFQWILQKMHYGEHTL